ncbi:MAG: hypothetical protein AB8G22_11480 [Saprospiraceae bacterium]
MKINKYQGTFEVLDTFAIRSRNQFYLIGKLTKGRIEENWFLNIPLNDSLDLTIRVHKIEAVEIASDDDEYILLTTNCDEEAIDFYLALRIGGEYLPVSIEGLD